MTPGLRALHRDSRSASVCPAFVQPRQRSTTHPVGAHSHAVPSELSESEDHHVYTAHRISYVLFSRAIRELLLTSPKWFLLASFQPNHPESDRSAPYSPLILPANDTRTRCLPRQYSFDRPYRNRLAVSQQVNTRYYSSSHFPRCQSHFSSLVYYEKLRLGSEH